MPHSHASAQVLQSWFSDDWVKYGDVICFLQGVSGVGKATVARHVCRNWPGPAVLITATGVDLGLEELLFEIAASFERQGFSEMADAGEFEDGLLTLLNAGALVVITEFDSALDPATRLPHKSIIDFFARTSKEDVSGRILLISNQRVSEASWSERISFKYLSPPNEDEAVAYLSAMLADRGLESEVPTSRRGEVVRWLARNPRAMQTFVVCLQEEQLESLIELEPEAWALRDEVVSPELLSRLEEAFIANTLDKLDANAQLFVEYLSIYRKPFQVDAMDRLGALVSDVNGARNSLANRFLLSQASAGWFAVHPVVKHLARRRLADDKRRLGIAHSRAADHYARHFKARGGPSPNLPSVGDSFVEARFHLIKANREPDFEDIASRYRQELSARYRNLTYVPSETGDSRGLLIVLLAALTHDDPGFEQLRTILAELLVRRGRQGDHEIALRQATIATRRTSAIRAWKMRLELTWQLDGVRAAQVAAKQAVDRVSLNELWHIYRMHALKLHEHNMTSDALAFLNEGFTKVSPNSLFGLYSLAGYILSSRGRANEAVNFLINAYRRLGPEGMNRLRLFEQALFIAYGRKDVAAIAKIQAVVATDGPVNNLTLCHAVTLACLGKFREAALLLDNADSSPAIDGQKIFFFLCSRDVSRAASAAASANLITNPASSWVRALVALCEQKREVYLLEMQACLGRELTEQESLDDSLWLRAWLDKPAVPRVYPAFYFPLLPAMLTGLDADLLHYQIYSEVLDDEFWTQTSLPKGSHSIVPLNDLASNITQEKLEITLNTYNVNADQVGAVGDKAKALGNTFAHGASGDNLSSELEKFFAELSLLRKAMKEAAIDPEHDVAVAEVAKAELAAKAGDGKTATEHLKKAGKWTLAVATTIGASLVSSVLKGELNL